MKKSNVFVYLESSKKCSVHFATFDQKNSLMSGGHVLSSSSSIFKKKTIKVDILLTIVQ
jgi:hypothetical protein